MPPKQTIRAFSWALLLGAASLSMTACKLEHKSEADKNKSDAVAGSFENKSFDPNTEVRELWENKAVPTLTKMAADFQALKSELAANPNTAGALHGHREKGENTPWNLATRVSGTVVAAETELSAGTADIDVDGDGKADLQIQIGPIIKGTVIRDALPFVSFSSYTNQIEFAQLANAFNDRAYEASVKSLDRRTLLGKKVELLGVFSQASATEFPLLTVVSIKVSGK